MRKNFKRFINVLMVAVMVIALASGCGKKEETKAEPEKDENTEEPEAKIQAAAGDIDIYDSIKNSVITNYLESKKIAASDFKWPVYGEDENGAPIDEGHLWTYFNTIFDNYRVSGNLFDTTDLPVEPSGDKDLMDAVLIGIDEWTKLPENEDMDPLDLKLMLVPAYEKIPANVTFTE